MKSYDDLQRFKEKTQTNHIEFKDMSEQSLNSDSTNWAIIKQLLSDGADTVLDKSQRIDVAAPQPIDPAMLRVPPQAAVSQPVPSITAVDPAVSVAGSLLDSISSSLKPQTQTQPQTAAASTASQPSVVPPEPAVAPVTTPVPLVKVVDLRPESVAQSGSSLFEQLAAVKPPQSSSQSAPSADVSPSAPQTPAAAGNQPQQAPTSVGYQPQPVAQQAPATAAYQPQPVAQQAPATAAYQPQPAAQQAPATAGYQPQPAAYQAPATAGYQPQPAAYQVPAAAGYQPQPAAYQAPAAAGYPPQPVFPAPPAGAVPPVYLPQSASSALFSGQAGAATSSNISYKQLFSPTNGSAERIVSKEMPLQSLLEKIASCR